MPVHSTVAPVNNSHCNANMASISPIPKMKLKLLVDKNSENVVFAEADKDFIDFLIHLLSLPVATAVRLLKEKTMDVGSLSHFYESLQNLPDSYFKPNQNKYSLLNPRVPILSAAAAATEISLTLTSDGPEFDTVKAYTCASCISHMAVVPNLMCPKCECRSMNRELSYVNPPWKGGGFLKGLVSYTGPALGGSKPSILLGPPTGPISFLKKKKSLLFISFSFFFFFFFFWWFCSGPNLFHIFVFGPRLN
jgi:hypothetical protein